MHDALVVMGFIHLALSSNQRMEMPRSIGALILKHCGPLSSFTSTAAVVVSRNTGPDVPSSLDTSQPRPCGTFHALPGCGSISDYADLAAMQASAGCPTPIAGIPTA